MEQCCIVCQNKFQIGFLIFFLENQLPRILINYLIGLMAKTYVIRRRERVNSIQMKRKQVQ